MAEELKYEVTPLDVRDKIVWIKLDTQYSQVQTVDLEVLSTKFKKQGARSVLITDKTFDINTISDDQMRALWMKKNV